MKNFLFSVLFISLFVSVIYAENEPTDQYRNEYYKKALDQYVHSLNHNTDGVVESAIINLMSLKKHCPQMSFEKAIENMEEVRDTNQSSEIRVMASFALKYFETDDVTEIIPEFETEEVNRVFAIMLDRGLL